MNPSATPDPAKPAPRVGFVSLGCPKNLTDSELIITRLAAEGYETSKTFDHIGTFRRQRGRHQLNVKKPERYCTVPVFNEAHKLFTQTQTGN